MKEVVNDFFASFSFTLALRDNSSLLRVVTHHKTLISTTLFKIELLLSTTNLKPNIVWDYV